MPTIQPEPPSGSAQAGGQAICLEPFNTRDGAKVLEVLRDHLEVVLGGKILIMFEPTSPFGHHYYCQAVLHSVLASGELILPLVGPVWNNPATAGASLVLSTVVWREGHPHRLAMKARMVGVKKVPLRTEPEQIATVLIARIACPAQVLMTNAREGVRVDLEGGSLISFSSQSCIVIPLNISLGGVGFNCPKGALAVGQRLRLDLKLHDKTTPAQVETVRRLEAFRRLEYMGAKFLPGGGAGSASQAKFKADLQLAIAAEQARQIRQLRGESTPLRA